MKFKTRDLLVRQRTQLINALRGHLAEHSVVAPQGVTNVRILEATIEEAETSLELLIVETARLYLTQIALLSEQIVMLEKVLQQEAAKEVTTARQLPVPGLDHVTAMAIEAFAPPMETFRRGRDFAAYLGLVPIQRSAGSKQALGRTSKMGQRNIRRLLITGAMTVVRWAGRKAPPAGSWLSRMLERKPRMLVAITLANKKCLFMGNIDSLRDWGHAKDYVRMQWMMLQQDVAEDFVIATGNQFGAGIHQLVGKGAGHHPALRGRGRR